MDYYISVILIGISALMSCACGLPIFKIIQLSGYKPSGVFAYFKATRYNILIRYILLTLFSFMAMIVYVGCFGAYAYARYCAASLYIILAIVFIVSSVKWEGPKYTGRILRLISAEMILSLVLGAGIAFAAYYSPYCQTVTAALGALTPFTVIAANAIMSPIEKLNNRKYVVRAKKKLAEYSPTVIGITGSFGKTTAKNILAEMLSEKYENGQNNVVATPGSFNTPMGVCMTVNNGYNGEKYLIAELGARYKGDIKQLCNIVSPKIGLITAIGDMHLETFKTREGVADAKYELAESLPNDGLLVLNGYNESCKKLAERNAPCRVQVAGAENNIRYENLKIDGNGTHFDLIIDGVTYNIKTKLLGAHIPELVCSCAEIASYLGVSAEKIAEAVKYISPVEHRLQLLPGADASVTVIDDAYNSNPDGARNALQVLSSFDAKKIIITPGFVELGDVEKQCNTELGKDIAGVCDYALLVGSRAEDIKRGAIDGGMDESNIEIFGSRDEAVEALKDISGDRVILFENDLPDNIK